MSTQFCCWEGTSDGTVFLKLINEDHNAAKNVTKENLIALFHLFDHVQLNFIKYSNLLILYVVSIILQIQLPNNRRMFM